MIIELSAKNKQFKGSKQQVQLFVNSTKLDSLQSSLLVIADKMTSGRSDEYICTLIYTYIFTTTRPTHYIYCCTDNFCFLSNSSYLLPAVRLYRIQKQPSTPQRMPMKRRFVNFSNSTVHNSAELEPRNISYSSERARAQSQKLGSIAVVIHDIIS